MTRSIRTKEYTIFVERLRKEHEEAGLTQVEVAKELKRPQSHISNVDVIALQTFAKMYDKDITYFVK